MHFPGNSASSQWYVLWKACRSLHIYFLVVSFCIVNDQLSTFNRNVFVFTDMCLFSRQIISRDFAEFYFGMHWDIPNETCMYGRYENKTESKQYISLTTEQQCKINLVLAQYWIKLDLRNTKYSVINASTDSVQKNSFCYKNIRETFRPQVSHCLKTNLFEKIRLLTHDKRNICVPFVCCIYMLFGSPLYSSVLTVLKVCSVDLLYLPNCMWYPTFTNAVSLFYLAYSYLSDGLAHFYK